jgi:hypothetical protein
VPIDRVTEVVLLPEELDTVLALFALLTFSLWSDSLRAA